MYAGFRLTDKRWYSRYNKYGILNPGCEISKLFEMILL